ncbi:MAG: acetyl-CoA carboxylase biotin carboxyl carrier protein subunit [Bacteroidetes bacterium]|nr:MAG: acetyl-CoA carboxylase biotin carboxyl carrier protein subunit [Bacteroidota bacterium]
MQYDIKLNDEQYKIELLDRKDNKAKIALDDRVYEVDITEVENGVYSIILDGTSFNVELIETENKKYNVNTLYNSYDIEIIDAETRYANSRKKDDVDDASFISTPMPGKVVKVLVKEGDVVKAGDTLIIVSAMKMESEYKAGGDKIVTKVLVGEGDAIDGHQKLILLEDIENN